jgi:predicted acetyltransferase
MELRQLRLKEGWKVELYQDGRSISRLWIANRRVRVGEVDLKVGGIAGVGTDPAFRKKGLASQVLQAALELMQGQDYDASFLFGIQDFYHRFGFATCMAEHRFSLDTRDAERCKSKIKMRPLSRGHLYKQDLAGMRRIYTRANAERTASVCRGRSWRGFPMASGFGIDPLVYVLAPDQAQVGAYVVIDDRMDRCRAAEVGSRDEEGMAAVLHLMAKRAVLLRRERISFCLPSDHDFAVYCRRFSLRDETQYDRNAGPMGRLINLATTLEKLLPLWKKRWASKESTLNLRSDIGCIAINKTANGDLKLDTASQRKSGIELGQDALMQLLMGYRSVADLEGAGLLRGNRGQKDLLALLCPLEQGHMSWPDRF